MSLDLPQLGVVVVNFGTHELLATNLARLSRSIPGAVVVVVDNRSSDDERTAVEALAYREGWATVLPPVNLGFGGGMNVGSSVALERGAEALLLLNPDAFIDDDSVKLLRERVAEQPMTLASPKVLRPDGSVWFAGNDLHLTDGHMCATRRRPPGTIPSDVIPWLSGACLMVSREVWQKLQGFDEEYFLYWEDVDLSYRATQLGARLLVEEEAVAVHDEGGSQESGTAVAAKSDLYYYYNIRNRLLFAAKHLGPETRRRWRRHSVGAAFAILRRGGRRHLLKPRGPVLTAIRATRDGLRASRDLRVRSDRPLVVMLSFPPPLPTSNPYNMMLADSLRAVPNVVVRNFSWRGALTERYDVFHAHWPEILVAGASPLKKAVKQTLFLALVTKLRLTGTPWVRTVHNLKLPRGISRREEWLLKLADRWTTLRVTINESTRLPSDQPFETVLHGDYVDWYAAFDKPDPAQGRVAFFGTIRAYKGVTGLLEAFREIPDPNLSLHVSGRPSSEDYERDLRRLAAGDMRISLSFAFLDEADLVREVGEAELVVLPYPEMHNSGATLAALSLERPVLVPRNAVNEALSEEVGPGWVHTYDGDLHGSDIERALSDHREHPPLSPPDFTARTWTEGGHKHVAAYRRALRLARTPRATGGLGRRILS